MAYPDIAVPGLAELDLTESVVIGEGANWSGKLLASSDLSPTESTNYILKQMAAKGWQLMSSVHADKSTMVFSKANKLMQVEVAKSSMLQRGASMLTYIASFKN